MPRSAELQPGQGLRFAVKGQPGITAEFELGDTGAVVCLVARPLGIDRLAQVVAQVRASRRLRRWGIYENEPGNLQAFVVSEKNGQWSKVIALLPAVASLAYVPACSRRDQGPAHWGPLAMHILLSRR